MRGKEIEFEIKNISDLKEASYNPRSITEEAKKGLKNSLQEFGDISGIVFNKKTGNLVSGHQRLKSLKELYGENLKIENEKIICPNGENFKIRIVDWDINKEKLANITANNNFIQGSFSNEFLKTIFKDINVTNEIIFDLGLQDLQTMSASMSIKDVDFEDITLFEKPNIFKIICNSAEEVRQLKLLFNTKKPSITFSEFIKLYNE